MDKIKGMEILTNAYNAVYGVLEWHKSAIPKLQMLNLQSDKRLNECLAKDMFDLCIKIDKFAMSRFRAEIQKNGVASVKPTVKDVVGYFTEFLAFLEQKEAAFIRIKKDMETAGMYKLMHKFECYAEETTKEIDRTQRELELLKPLASNPGFMALYVSDKHMGGANRHDKLKKRDKK